MKFIIRRTSGRGDDESPCKGAVKGHYIRVDERVVDDPERDYDDEAWFLEVKSLHDLLKLSSKHGEIIVSKYFMNHDLWSLEIYDDYRE
jgi:hypothetical protein